MLLVRDTIRLIGEIPVQAGRALQKAGFNFFFLGGWRRVSLGSFFYYFFFSHISPYSIRGQMLQSSPEPSIKKQPGIRYYIFFINQMSGVVYMFIVPLLPLHRACLSPPTFPPWLAEALLGFCADGVSPWKTTASLTNRALVTYTQTLKANIGLICFRAFARLRLKRLSWCKHRPNWDN